MANGNSTVHNSTHDQQANKGSEISTPSQIPQDELDEATRSSVAEQLDCQHDLVRADEENRNLFIGLLSISQNWDFWAARPTLVANEAVPLMNGCDPESWRERARREDPLPGYMIAAIERGLEIAKGEAANPQSPSDWLAWGKRHGLDLPTLKSANHLRDPDVNMWPLFADAVERAVQAGERYTGKSKAPRKFSEAFDKLLDEIDKRYNTQGGKLDRNAMPGTKDQLRYVARKFEPKSMTVELSTFDDYIAGVVKFKKGRQAIGTPNPYTDLFPEYSTLGAQKN
ncbi:hypothetical protein [Sideroxydans sp. CL21]|uniref:hypothetical protein n=1 Tax=Sideroxydans sp. CL21 TaxID=2600596 RepID=UPI0024BC5174|nr:hypothetical protein [Sideroxydans sp. CL21]